MAPWSSLDDTPDQTLCLVEISLTHMKNIELSRWLVAPVKGKRERPFFSVTAVTIELWHKNDTDCLYECILSFYVSGCG